MGRISFVMKKAIEVFGIVVLLLLLVVSISLIRTTGQKTGTEAYPPPATATPSPTATTLPYPVPETEPNPSSFVYKKFTGPDCMVDTVNGLAIGLPKGWYGSIDTTSINITNYDPDSLQFQHGKALNEPADHIKIEIYVFEIDPNLTVDQVITAHKEQSRQKDNTPPIITMSENSPYSLGRYKGITYSITDTAGWNAQAITVRVNEKKAISLQLFPADSPAFAKAISILSTLDGSSNPVCSEAGSVLPELPQISTETGQSPAVITDFSCPRGVTYPGSEAKSSLIDLQMPFPWGQTWIVGGGGSFYGNNHHCNYYNNYYATDWNKPDNNDAGAIVVAVADGVVSEVEASFPDCNPGGRYGCYVKINHEYGFQTLYAHLGTVSVSTGTIVKVGTVIGTVGATGTNSPHLHLTFWHLEFVDTQYMQLSQCYNNGQTCPNGEPALYPQGYRPSPMWTTYGNAYLADGIPFTSVNGYPVFLPMIRK